VEASYTKARERFHVPAEGGNAWAMAQLAGLLREGRGGPKNEKQAFHLYHKAADSGDAGSMDNVAKMYEVGLGVAKDEKAATLWYRKAIGAGAPQALLSLGRKHAEGRGVRKSEGEARAYLRKAAEVESTEAVWEAVLWFFQHPEFGLGRLPHHTATLMLLTLAEESKHRERLVSDAAKIPTSVRVAVQRRLRSVGHFAGPLDGKFGPHIRRRSTPGPRASKVRADR
jgi:TPR repeat protein